MNDDVTLDELLATYAEAPDALTAAQRARVEAALADDGGPTVAAKIKVSLSSHPA